MLGPVHLCIISDKSSEVLISHNFSEDDLLDILPHARPIQVAIFDRPKTYHVVIDRGSFESSLQF